LVYLTSLYQLHSECIALNGEMIGNVNPKEWGRCNLY